MFKENPFHSKLHEIDHNLRKYDLAPSSSKSVPHSNSNPFNFLGKISEGAELVDLVHHINFDGYCNLSVPRTITNGSNQSHSQAGYRRRQTRATNSENKIAFVDRSASRKRLKETNDSSLELPSKRQQVSKGDGISKTILTEAGYQPCQTRWIY